MIYVVAFIILFYLTGVLWIVKDAVENVEDWGPKTDESIAGVATFWPFFLVGVLLYESWKWVRKKLYKEEKVRER